MSGVVSSPPFYLIYSKIFINDCLFKIEWELSSLAAPECVFSFANPSVVFRLFVLSSVDSAESASVQMPC